MTIAYEEEDVAEDPLYRKLFFSWKITEKRFPLILPGFSPNQNFRGCATPPHRENTNMAEEYKHGGKLTLFQKYLPPNDLLVSLQDVLQTSRALAQASQLRIA